MDGYFIIRPAKSLYIGEKEPTLLLYFKERCEFVINLTTTDMVRAADWCGTYTGRKVDKFAKHNLEKIKATEEKDAEYEKMQKIHSAHTAMSANERLDWLRKHRKD